MKNNILNRFAFNDLKKHKKDSLALMFMILLIGIIAMILSLVSDKVAYAKLNDYQYLYGTYTYKADTFEGNVDNIILHTWKGNDVSLNDTNTCIVSAQGLDFNKNQFISFEGNPECIGIKLKDGVFPKKENEIAVKVSYLYQWGYDSQIGDTIDIPYASNIHRDHFYEADAKVMQFKIVGILEETGTYNNVTNLDNNLYSKLYITLDVLEQITGVTSRDVEFTNLEQNKYVSQIFNYATPVFTMAMLEGLCYLVAVILIYGFTIMSFEKKLKDYTLLRSIGITKKQLYYVVSIQTCMLSFIPLVLACVVFYVAASVLSVSPAIDKLLWNVVKILLIVFISYFIPGSQVSNQSLTGTFEGQDYQMFYYQYKKPHLLNSIYLGWRHFVISKKQMFFKIILVSAIIFQCLGLSNKLLTNETVVENHIITRTLSRSINSEIKTQPNLSVFGEYESLMTMSTDELSELLEITFDSYLQRRDFFLDCYKEYVNLSNIYGYSDVIEFYIEGNEVQAIDNNSLELNNMLRQEETNEIIKKSFIILALVVVYVFQSMFDMFNQKNNIGTFQLLGMTKREISKIYFFKVVFVGLISFAFTVLLYYANIGYYPELEIFKQSFFISLAIVFSIVLFIHMIEIVPVLLIIRRDAFTNKNAMD